MICRLETDNADSFGSLGDTSRSREELTIHHFFLNLSQEMGWDPPKFSLCPKKCFPASTWSGKFCCASSFGASKLSICWCIVCFLFTEKRIASSDGCISMLTAEKWVLAFTFTAREQEECSYCVWRALTSMGNYSVHHFSKKPVLATKRVI